MSIVMTFLTPVDTNTGLAIGFILLVLWLAFVLWVVYYLFIEYGKLGETEHYERRKNLVRLMETRGVPAPIKLGRYLVFEFGAVTVTLVDAEDTWYAYRGKDGSNYVCSFHKGRSDTRLYNRGLELLRGAARGEASP